MQARPGFSLQMKSDDKVTPLRKAYEKPKLEVLGDVRAITMGGSPGTGESGAPLARMDKTHP
jgi:hypothetical protein